MVDRWDDSAEQLAIKMAGERCTAAEIGVAVGVSRNAVIGKLRRLGVPLLSGLKRGVSPFWTAKRDAELRRLWLDSVPAAEIATKLGAVNAVAVAGRVRHLKLPRRATGKPPVVVKPRPVKAVAIVPIAAPEPVSEPRADGALPFLDAQFGRCRYPLWPDTTRVSIEAKFVCGEASATAVYCPEHTKLCAGSWHFSDRRAA